MNRGESNAYVTLRRRKGGAQHMEEPLCVPYAYRGYRYTILPSGCSVTLDDGLDMVGVGPGNHCSVNAEPLQRTIALPFASDKMSKCPGSICPHASSVHAKIRRGSPLVYWAAGPALISHRKFKLLWTLMVCAIITGAFGCLSCKTALCHRLSVTGLADSSALMAQERTALEKIQVM